MTVRRRYVTLVICLFFLLITYLHYSTFPRIYSFHDIYKEFYYIPIFLGALAFGLKGALLIYASIFVFDLPFVIEGWTGAFVAEAGRLLHLGLQGLFAIFAGYLSDRERKARTHAEKERYLARTGQVATAIVHDLKNPLISILGFSKRIKDKKGNVDEAIDMVRDSALTMQKIVQDVLDFAKPLNLTLRREDIREVIDKACRLCETKAEGAGVEIVRRVPASPVSIEMDSFHLERSLMNLVSNAIEASGRGQRVSVSATPGKYKCTITVADQGSGMDEETLESIFVPFTTKKKEGTGLGMAIAKKIVDAHKGKIDIVSRPGQGTEVRIELPYRAGR
ncbi:MAG: HAMP domain-containing histidine kinase [Nitrospirae bacterium]|nr:HAMP domain-containing histidine kinase [Nitrospirota bacterium]